MPATYTAWTPSSECSPQIICQAPAPAPWSPQDSFNHSGDFGTAIAFGARTMRTLPQESRAAAWDAAVGHHSAKHWPDNNAKERVLGA